MDVLSKFKKRLDGWLNVLVGLGGKQDKTRKTQWGDFQFLTDEELSYIYAGEGFASRIIDVRANDMTREWITIENDDENIIMNELKRLKAKSKFNEALRWSGLYGGSVIIVGAMDSEELKNPLKINENTDIEWLYVVDKSQIEIGTSVFNNNPLDRGFGKIESYKMYIGPLKRLVEVHKSRVFEFKGKPAPKQISDLDNEIRYWGMSEIQGIYEKLKSYGGGFQSVENILFEFIVGKYKLKGLAEKLATGQEEEIIKRMEIVAMFKSTINAILLDAEHEDYIRDSANISGLSDILDRLMMNLSGVTGIPVTRLFGRSPAGQNATGESDLKNYYDDIAARQENSLEDPLQELVNMIAITNGLSGEFPIKFNSLFQLTEKERAEVDNKDANTYNIYIDQGVISSEEVRIKKFPELEEI